MYNVFGTCKNKNYTQNYFNVEILNTQHALCTIGASQRIGRKKMSMS